MFKQAAGAVGAVLLVATLAACGNNNAKDVGKISVDWTGNDIAIEAVEDPDVKGVVCHVAYFNRSLIDRLQQGNWFEDPSDTAIACRQTGPITLPAKLAKETTVFSADTSLLFKETRVIRLWDEAHNTLVYLAISRKVIDGAPANSVSTVPVMPWGGR